MDVCLFIIIPAYIEVILYILHHMRLINYLHDVFDQVPTLLAVDPRLFGFVHSANGFNNHYQPRIALKYHESVLMCLTASYTVLKFITRDNDRLKTS